MRKIKFLAVFLTMATIFATSFLFSASAATPANIKVISQSGVVDDIVTISTTITKDSNLLNGALTLSYNKYELQYVSSSIGSILSGGLNDLYHDAEKGQISLAHIQTELLKEGGELFQVQFKIIDSVSRDLPLTLKVSELVSQNENAIAHTISQGSVKPNHMGWLGDYHYIAGMPTKSQWIGDYYVDATGKCQYNKWVGNYYVGGNGKYIKNGWAGDYYCGSDGKYVKNRWVGDYYVDGSGKCQYNKWIGDYYVGSNGKYVRNSWAGDYYFNSSGKHVKNQWVGNYYVGKDGKYLKSQWVGDYYVDGSGKCQYNKWIGNYYVNGSGKYMKNAWVGNYYVGKDGKYVKNTWVQSYYCDDSGKYLKNQWQKINGSWYYFTGNGKYATGTITINNKSESFHSNGRWKG